MPTLSNPKHERFAQELAKGKTQVEAYEAAGYRDGRRNAHRLGKDEGILGRVAELLDKREAIHAQATASAIKQTGLTKEWVIETLKENVARAMQATPVRLDEDGEAVNGEYTYQGSVANRALELLGKELGMFVDRKEVGRPGEFESMNADQLRDFIAREAAALGIGPEAPAHLNGKGKPH